MFTRIVVGALLTDFAIITIALLYVAARNPKNPWWANETFMDWILPIVTGCVVAGPALMFEAFVFNRATLTSTELIATLAILAAGVALVIIMRIPKRIAIFEQIKLGPLKGQKV